MLPCHLLRLPPSEKHKDWCGSSVARGSLAFSEPKWHLLLQLPCAGPQKAARPTWGDV